MTSKKWLSASAMVVAIALAVIGLVPGTAAAGAWELDAAASTELRDRIVYCSTDHTGHMVIVNGQSWHSETGSIVIPDGYRYVKHWTEETANNSNKNWFKDNVMRDEAGRIIQVDLSVYVEPKLFPWDPGNWLGRKLIVEIERVSGP